MHLCIPAHTIPIHFIVNLHSLAAIYSQFVVPLWVLTLVWKCFYSGVQMERKNKAGGFQKNPKNNMMNRVNVCELICDSSRQVHKAYRSLSPPQLDTGGRDDCALFQMMTIMSLVWVSRGAFSRDVDVHAKETDSGSDRRPLSGCLGVSVRTGAAQKRSAERCFSVTVVAGDHITTRAPVRLELRDVFITGERRGS